MPEETELTEEQVVLPYLGEFQNTKDPQKGLSQAERVRLSSLKTGHMQNNPDLEIIRQARHMQALPSISALETKNKRRAIMVDFFQKGFVHHNMQHDSMYVLNQQNIKMKNMERQMQIEMMSNYSSEKRTQVKKELKERGSSLPVLEKTTPALKGSFYT